MPKAPAFAAVLALALAATPPAVHALGKGTPSFYDRHVLFDNSDAPAGGYAASSGWAIGPSTLELVDGKLPVETAYFASPPNALRLSWLFAPGGDWQATIEITRRYARPIRCEGNARTLRVCADTEITAASSPRLFLKDAGDNATPAITLVSGDERIPAGRWVEIRLPFERIFDIPVKGTTDSSFRVADTPAVTFLQGLDDGEAPTGDI